MKSMQITRRWLVLLALLLSSVAAAVMVSRDEAGGVVAAATKPTVRHSGAAGHALGGVEAFSVSGDQLARLNARRIDEELEPLFDVVRKSTYAPRSPTPSCICRTRCSLAWD